MAPRGAVFISDMRIETQDPNTFITDRGPGFVVYENTDGKRWIILGTCICCGQCEVGSNSPYLLWVGQVGTKNACIDTRVDRLDCPVLPTISENNSYCTLTGHYLNAD